MTRFELQPGEQIVLKSSSVGIQDPSGERSKHPVVYDARIGQGTYTMLFRLNFPDINKFQVKDGDFRGSLYTGEVDFTVQSR